MKKFPLSPIVQAALVATTLVPSAGFAAVGRGADVNAQASGCNIGPFPQVTKAGAYNELCNVMQDSEKCLALVKRHFSFNGEAVTVHPATEKDRERAEYCLDVLKRDLLVVTE